ncbi:unnamed protein product [Kuraishia capsulata CBS 1993]|uniref:Uncharacterized protein n=1 Tax=Kuraishia capsulata CBS 1993 TaxID=1382522 RepID=W6MQ55_9ASCO|nr:uncharacterized protein KUCA_T00003365001 [Kuraishia capsulata CBS 1993]CDK27387.1 unnamed protein product [Kuraishia capsulata CBS 1993]
MLSDQQLIRFFKDTFAGSSELGAWAACTVLSAFTAATVGYFSGRNIGTYRYSPFLLEGNEENIKAAVVDAAVVSEVSSSPMLLEEMFESHSGKSAAALILFILVDILLVSLFCWKFKQDANVQSQNEVLSTSVETLRSRLSRVDRDHRDFENYLETRLESVNEMVQSSKKKSLASIEKATKKAQAKLEALGMRTAAATHSAIEKLKPLIKDAKSQKEALTTNQKEISEEISSAERKLSSLLLVFQSDSASVKEAMKIANEQSAEMLVTISEEKGKLETTLKKLDVKLCKSHMMLRETRRLFETNVKFDQVSARNMSTPPKSRSEIDSEIIQQLFWPLNEAKDFSLPTLPVETSMTPPLLDLNTYANQSVLDISGVDKDSTDLLLHGMNERLNALESLINFELGQLDRLEFRIKHDVLKDFNHTLESLKNTFKTSQVETMENWSSWLSTLLGVSYSFYVDAKTAGSFPALMSFKSSLLRVDRAECSGIHEQELLAAMKSLQQAVHDCFNDSVLLLLQFFLFKLSRSDLQNASVVVSSVLADSEANVRSTLDRAIDNVEYQVFEIFKSKHFGPKLTNELRELIHRLRVCLLDDCVGGISSLHDLLHVNIQGTAIMVEALMEKDKKTDEAFPQSTTDLSGLDTTEPLESDQSSTSASEINLRPFHISKERPAHPSDAQ